MCDFQGMSMPLIWRILSEKRENLGWALYKAMADFLLFIHTCRFSLFGFIFILDVVGEWWERNGTEQSGRHHRNGDENIYIFLFFLLHYFYGHFLFFTWLGKDSCVSCNCQLNQLHAKQLRAQQLVEIRSAATPSCISQRRRKGWKK